MQILTRRLGVTARASALAVYVQATFLGVSTAFFWLLGMGDSPKASIIPASSFCYERGYGRLRTTGGCLLR